MYILILLSVLLETSPKRNGDLLTFSMNFSFTVKIRNM